MVVLVVVLVVVVLVVVAAVVVVVVVVVDDAVVVILESSVRIHSFESAHVMVSPSAAIVPEIVLPSVILIVISVPTAVPEPIKFPSASKTDLMNSKN